MRTLNSRATKKERILIEELLYGREITAGEWKESKSFLEQANQRPAFQQVDKKWQCQRCGTTDNRQRISAPCVCKGDCFFCAACLNMGKVKRCGSLYALAEPNLFPKLTQSPLQWAGTLSAEQARASKDVVESVAAKTTRLIWAVAGAGKTEMIFEGIAQALMKGERVCIASPRIDVCLELAPRIQAAFPAIPLALLYGGMEEAYRYTPLVIATTHQLLRFKEAFDLLIIDEIDSFPYHSDPALHFGAAKARKKRSALLYLSATPTRAMQMEVTKNHLPATILPARYHRYPLPVPERIWLGNWREHIQKRKRRTKFLQLMQAQLKAGRRFLVFLPHIALMMELEEWLRELLLSKSFAAVSAEDPDRVEKVQRMREEEYDFLLTTTILERGVTFRDIDVLVLGAEDEIFNESSLVQIAGRVGRHQDHPTGKIWYGHFGQTKAIKGAVKQIKRMNQRAREGGLLHELSDM